MAIYTYLNDIIDYQRSIDYSNYKRIKGMIEAAWKYNCIEEEKYKILLTKLDNKYRYS